jgi:hypothetical protein
MFYGLNNISRQQRVISQEKTNKLLGLDTQGILTLETHITVLADNCLITTISVTLKCMSSNGIACCVKSMVFVATFLKK